VACAVLFFHRRAAAFGAAFSTDDLREYFIPVRALLQHIVHSGDWPFWQRSIYAGFPLWSSSEAALLLPTTWLFFGFNAARGLTLASLLHLIAAALGVFTWMRHRGRSPGASATGAFVFALGGAPTVHLDHWTFSATMMWLPWTLLAVDVALERGLSPALFLAAAGGIAGAWFGGASQMAYFSTLVTGGYVAFRVLGTRGRTWPLLLVLPAGLLLAAPVLLAGAEFSAHSPRAGGMELLFAAEYHWQDRRSLGLLLFPNLWGPPQTYNGVFNYWEMTGYVGLPTLVLLLGVRPRGIGWYFLFLVGFSLLVSFGLETPVYELLFQYLPGFSNFRVPSRALYITNFAASFLAAEAVDTLAEQPRWKDTVFTVLVTAILITVALRISRYALPWGLRPDGIEPALPWVRGLLLASGAWMVVRHFLPAPRVLFPTGIALLLFVDLHHHFSDYMAVADAKQLMADTLPSVPPPPGPGRVVHLTGQPNLLAGSGLEGVNGYSQLMAARIYDLFYAMRDGQFSHTFRTKRNHEYGKQSVAPLTPLFPLFAAPYLVTNAPVSTPQLRLIDREGPFWRYELPALPLAFWSQRYTVMEDAEFQSQLGRFNPFEQVALAPTSTPLPPAGKKDYPHRPATLAERTTNLTRVQVDAPAPGVLVVLDPWFPGWSAQVDGKPAPLLRADYAFMAIPLDAGRHEVTLRYFPTTLLPALACILAVLGAVGGWTLRRARRP
jgi:Bacterial membrane protein YfhO